MEPQRVQSPSFRIQNEAPLSPSEIEPLTRIFQELVLAEQELCLIETECGTGRVAQIAKDNTDAWEKFFAGESDEASKALELMSKEQCPELDKKFRRSQQKVLHTAYKVVELLRSRKEYVAWECNLSLVLLAMETQLKTFRNIVHMVQDESLTSLAAKLEEDLEQHRDQSSELFLRHAHHTAVLAKDTSLESKNCDQAFRLSDEVSIKCVNAFDKFRKIIRECNGSGKPLSAFYIPFALSLKEFGLAFKNYKAVATAFTAAQALQMFAPTGTIVRVAIPQVEQ